jgi:hypothetical protein
MNEYRHRPCLAGLRLRLHERLQLEPCQTVVFAPAPGVEPALEPLAASKGEAEPRFRGSTGSASPAHLLSSNCPWWRPWQQHLTRRGVSRAAVLPRRCRAPPPSERRARGPYCDDRRRRERDRGGMPEVRAEDGGAAGAGGRPELAAAASKRRGETGMRGQPPPVPM